MTRLRSALVLGSAVALFTAVGAMGTATAADSVQVREPGCAQLGAYGPGWADIHNICGHVISASVEVDGWDPACIQISGFTTETIGLEAGDEPYYAYDNC